MAYDGLMKDIRTLVALGTPSRVPAVAHSEEFDVRWYNRGTYEEIITDPDKLAACWIAAVKGFDYDWAWLQVDDCIVYEVLGVGCVGSGNILRATSKYLPATKETLKGLKMPNPHKDGRMPLHLEAIRQVRKEFGDRVCVTGRTEAPFSSTALLYGIEETMMLMYGDPDLLHATNEFFVELQTLWGQAQYEAGAHALWVGDCNAMSNMLSLKHYTDFAFGPCQKLARNYKQIGVLSFMHASEEKLPYIEKQAELGVDVLSVGPGADIAAAKRAVTGKCALLGNLDPIAVLKNGTPARVAQETERILKTAAPGGGYIFGPGEMVPRDTPEANMRAMMRAAREFGC